MISLLISLGKLPNDSKRTSQDWHCVSIKNLLQMLNVSISKPKRNGDLLEFSRSFVQFIFSTWNWKIVSIWSASVQFSLIRWIYQKILKIILFPIVHSVISHFKTHSRIVVYIWWIVFFCDLLTNTEIWTIFNFRFFRPKYRKTESLSQCCFDKSIP